MKHPRNYIWNDPVWLVGLLVVLILASTSGGYFAKQVSSWVMYDLLGRNPAQEMAPNVIAGQADRLAIPSLGLNAPLVYIEQKDEPTFQKALENGVVHYPGTALPGELGNAYYFGHSSDYVFKPGSYKTVFATLPKMKVGDEVYITDSVGKQFVYAVVETKVVEPDDISVLSQGEAKEKKLTLQASYPLGTALKRYLVVARLK
ncbi:MAG: sortase [bacterium]